MFHDILGHESWDNPDGTRNSAGCPDTDPWCLQNTTADTVAIQNMQSYVYWSGTEDARYTGYAWGFYTGVGSQGGYGKDVEIYAWAVRSGDVAAVPIPAAAWLFGSGLLGLIGVARRK